MVTPNRIELVFFDAGHTLLEPDPPVEVRYSDTAALFGAQAPPEEIRSRFHRLWIEGQGAREAALYRTDDRGTRAFWHAFVAQVFAPWVGRITDFEAFFHTLYEDFASRSAWSLAADARPTLEGLQGRGLRLGVISNWDKRLPVLLDALGIASLFEAVVTSAEVGFEKPSPAIFTRALEAVSLGAAEVVHVGDSYEADVIGAFDVGIFPVLLDRDSRHIDKPCHRVRSLGELLPLVDAANTTERR
jgi:putative hydrolase of the HAD superfamily